jgi:hypothetical protein
VKENHGALCRVLQRLDIAFKVEVDSLGVVVRVADRRKADVADDGVVVGCVDTEIKPLVVAMSAEGSWDSPHVGSLM